MVAFDGNCDHQTVLPVADDEAFGGAMTSDDTGASAAWLTSRSPPRKTKSQKIPDRAGQVWMRYVVALVRVKVSR